MSEPILVPTGTFCWNPHCPDYAQVGKHNLFVSQMGIAGSSSTGDYVVIAGQVGVCDHVHIGTGAIIGAIAGG